MRFTPDLPSSDASKETWYQWLFVHPHLPRLLATATRVLSAHGLPVADAADVVSQYRDEEFERVMKLRDPKKTCQHFVSVVCLDLRWYTIRWAKKRLRALGTPPIINPDGEPGDHIKLELEDLAAPRPDAAFYPVEVAQLSGHVLDILPASHGKTLKKCFLSGKASDKATPANLRKAKSRALAAARAVVCVREALDSRRGRLSLLRAARLQLPAKSRHLVTRYRRSLLGGKKFRPSQAERFQLASIFQELAAVIDPDSRAMALLPVHDVRILRAMFVDIQRTEIILKSTGGGLKTLRVDCQRAIHHLQVMTLALETAKSGKGRKFLSRDAAARLSGIKRKIVQAAILEGASAQEVADKLEKPVEFVKRSLVAALFILLNM
ncbi:MAG: hypothetical protein ACO1TE_24400 [Prosthecobacter sp.]